MRIRLTIVAAVATLLSSIGLYPLFEGTGWAWSGLGAILAVAAAGTLSRRFRLPAAAGPGVALAALLLYVTVRYASGQALLGIVPTPGSLTRLGQLVGDGWGAANRYAAPVPQGTGIELLATLGIGAVAVMVDLLAVRLRRAAPAGLPLLALYSVPAAIREESLSWVAFALGAAGFLGLLLADSREQVGAWGRPVPGRRWTDQTQGELPRANTLAATGRRLGLAAVAVAVTVPTIVPGVHPRGPLALGGGGGRDGSQTVTTPDPLVSLKRELTRQSDEIVLTYGTDDPEPDYLRLYALDRFDGDRWTYSPMQSSPRDRVVGRNLPSPPGLLTARSRAVTTWITVADKVRNMTFLPVPYAPSKVLINGDWRVHAPSLMIYSLRDDAAGRSYTVTSVRTEPTPDYLARAGSPDPEVLQHIRLPAGIPPQLRQLADQVTAGARTQYEQALKLQRWFTETGGFVYDTAAAPPQGTSDLVDFLQTSKRGYCEQFAAAMAMMARMQGIPARVSMGYTSGTRSSDGKWVVRARDAHAWPELYFQGAGWVRFEPTPSGPTGQGSATVPSYTRETAGGGQRPREGGQAPSSLSPSSAAESPDAGRGLAHRTDRGDTSAALDPAADPEDGPPVGWITAIPLVLLILAAPMAARMLARRRRWSQVTVSRAASGGQPGTGTGTGTAPGGQVLHGPPPADPTGAAHAAWQELRADAIDYGLTWRAADSPRTTARRLAESLEPNSPAVAALERIARAEERARYAPAPGPADTLREDVKIVREGFGAAVDRRARWRARLAPPSTMESFRDTGSRALDAFDHFSADRLRALLHRIARRRP
jgi:transglutaminase-like putative cysteine protease